MAIHCRAVKNSLRGTALISKIILHENNNISLFSLTTGGSDFLSIYSLFFQPSSTDFFLLVYLLSFLTSKINAVFSNLFYKDAIK
jgi:hypothetical protein